MPDENWVSSWYSAQTDSDSVLLDPGPPVDLSGKTLRQTIRMSLGGRSIRASFSNAHSDLPLEITQVRVRTTSRASDFSSLRFGGEESTVVAPRESAQSDPISLDLPDLGQLVVEIDFGSVASGQTFHQFALRRGELLAKGSGDARSQEVSSNWVLNRIDCYCEAEGCIAVLGDSLVDGYGSTSGHDRRWPDHLASGLSSAGVRFAVVNCGIGGNRLLTQTVGQPAIERLEADALSLPGARVVVLMIGVNDLGIPGAFDRPQEEISADQFLSAVCRCAERCASKGVLPVVSTIPPIEATSAHFPGFFSANVEHVRASINQGIKNSTKWEAFDLVAVVADQEHPLRLNPEYDCGDGLHLNDAGYLAVSAAFQEMILPKLRAM